MQVVSALPLDPPTAASTPKWEKEKSAMKRLTGFAVVTLFVLACSSTLLHATPSGPIRFSFLDSDGVDYYCDQELFSYGTTLAAGIDELQKGCGLPNGTLIGVVATVPASSGLPVTGSIIMFAGSTGDAVYGTYAGYQPLLITKTKASSTKFGWETLYVFEDDFTVYFNSYGYLVNEPSPGALANAQLAQGKSVRPVMVPASGTRHPAHK